MKQFSKHAEQDSDIVPQHSFSKKPPHRFRQTLFLSYYWTAIQSNLIETGQSFDRQLPEMD